MVLLRELCGLEAGAVVVMRPDCLGGARQAAGSPYAANDREG